MKQKFNFGIGTFFLMRDILWRVAFLGFHIILTDTKQNIIIYGLHHYIV